MMSLPVRNQGDQKWRSTPLGTTGRTIGSDGCALTCVSMVVGETPDKTLIKFKALGGIASSGDLTWTVIPAAYENFRFHYRWSTVNEEKNLANRKEVPAALIHIKTLLALGQPVILRVVHPIGSTHFVVAVGANGEDLVVNDPDGGKQITYSSKYGDPTKTLLAYVILIGPEREPQEMGGLIDHHIIRSAASALFKAAQLASGKNVAVYSKEILDTFL